MRVICNSSLFPPQPVLPFTLTSSPSLSSIFNKKNDSCSALRWPQKALIGALTGVLSVGLLVSSPLSPVLAETSTLDQHSSPEICKEDSTGGISEITAPEVVSNEEIVQEAWQIVNDSFMDSGRHRHRWSPETWLKKKEDILSTSIKTRSKAHDLIIRMLASLGDPYTRYLSPPEFSKMARYDMTGIGINIREVPGENGDVKLKVLGLILDGPAHSAGVKQGDEILSVNGMDVSGKSAFEVSSLIQGPNETSVNIKVKHGKCGPVQSIEVQRQSVARSPVLYRLEKIDNGATSVGYIRLKEFNALAKKDLLTAMKRLQGSGATSFVLDLRDNRGGLLQAGVEIAKLFLNEGDTVIYTVGRDSLDERGITTESRPLTTAPTIVLVNQNTASASEIVASALHDNCKAVLVGETTFGKGLIQSVFELRDGSGVVVTVGKYVTPNHKDINGNGIMPDFKSMPAWSEVSKRLSECSRSRVG